MLIPLRVYSCHSLLQSTITYDKAIEYCKKENISYIGIANENSMFSLFKWTQKLVKEKIKPITGIALKVDSGYVWAYCKNEQGFTELSNLITNSYFFHNGVLQPQHIKLPNCILLCDLSISKDHIAYLTKFNEVAIAISRQIRDQKDEPMLFNIANEFNLPIVAAPKCFYPQQDMLIETNCLWCIKNNTYLAEGDRPTVLEDEYFKSQAEYLQDFHDIPWAVKNSEIIAQKCNFQIKPHPPRMPKIKCKNPEALFKEMVQKGFKKRLQNNLLHNIKEKFHQEIEQNLQERLDYEISVISRMQFCEYFLIVSEIVQWTKNNNILVGPGRGSGAGSLVAYCLEITSIDPIKYNLMFERFLNPDRISLPDFDIDFCQQNRHKVINFIKERFSTECVAHIATFGSLQYRAALRDIGRVMQLPYYMVDELCKKLPAPFQGVAPTLKELRENKISTEFFTEENQELFKLAENVEGLPRHLSMHAAGVIISDENLANICPLFKEEDVEMPIIQFDMKDAESVGLVKFDILGLTILSTISKTLEFLDLKNIKIDLENLDLTDQNVFEMMTNGKTNSVFQIDSPGMRQVLKDMKPNCFEDVIAVGALYRPGPMDDIPLFIASKNGSSPIHYEYPELEPILKETYGVTVYQEQVLAIAKELAGYSLKEADLLRRAMGKKNHAEMEENKKKFVAGVTKICKGSAEKAENFFNNLARFASYGFNKAHATCYGMITYQTAYLKFHYTIEFLCSSMIYETSLEKLSEIIQEAINFDIQVIPPSINKSHVNFDIIDNCIYFGLIKVKGVGEIAKIIVEERQKNGYFTSLYNFQKRVNPNKKALENLILSGAFDEFNSNRAYLLQEAQEKKNNNITLFDDFFEDQIVDLTPIQQCIEEFDKLGFIFSNEALKMNLSHLKIYNSIDEISNFGLIYALGIKPIIKNTKDGKKIFAYEFFEKNGLKRLFANDFFEMKLQEVLIEVDKLPNRYIIKKIYTVSQYTQTFKKIFLNQNCTYSLLPGETSVFLKESNQNVFLGNFEINMQFLIKYYQNIVLIQ